MALLTLSVAVVSVLGLLLGVPALLRLKDSWRDRTEWNRLATFQPPVPERFDPGSVQDLPLPARRFFEFAIAPGTPLWPVAEIEMVGLFSLGTREDPGYRPMRAREILAAPHGFVWRLRLPGWMPVSGSDAGSVAGSWTRFRVFGLVPVVRAGGDLDHRRSAFGRYVAEAVFWTPAAVLPSHGARWEAVGEDTARVTLATGGLSETVEITVDAEGRVRNVSFMRWTNANPEKEYHRQPFGGTLSDFREVGGYRLPFRVEAGNMFGTDEFFAFFKVEVLRIRFPTRV